MVRKGRVKRRAPRDEGVRRATPGGGPRDSGDSGAPDPSGSRDRGGGGHDGDNGGKRGSGGDGDGASNGWRGRPSTLAREALLLYGALIVYASWYPFSGWRSLGLGPFDYLADPLPHYWTVFDVVTNVLGYMPFGALAVLAAWPRWRGARAIALAFAAGTLLSALMEAVQTWLPTRVASNLDLATNALGALLGALLAAPATGPLLERGWVRRLRFRWFERDAAALFVLAGLWPFATMFPQPRLFGLGDWPAELWQRFDTSMQDAMLAWLPLAWHVRAWPGALAGAFSDGVSETLVTALNLFGAAAFASLPMRERAPRVRLLLALIAATLGIKLGATFLQSQSGLVFDWATPAAVAGIACGTLAALAALRLPRPARAAAATAAIAVSLVLVNLLPVNPYFDVLLADWRQGRYLHFNGLARWLAWSWPWAALIWSAFSLERAWLARRAR